jgi:endonuclease G
VATLQKLITIFSLLFTLSNTLYSQNIFTLDNAQPYSKISLEYVDHTYFRIGFNAEKLQSSWVLYLLTKQMVSNKKVERSTKFIKDNSVSKSALSSDYTKSGYDRGHLCPAADMAWDAAAMKATFLMSNISPQKPQFNRGKWKALEEKVREWAMNNDSIIVITGAILDTCNLGVTGKNKVVIPCRFYKIIIDISYPTFKSIAFIMENDNLKADIFTYSVSIKEIENATGLNFFPNFDNNSTIAEIESSNNVFQWE